MEYKDYYKILAVSKSATPDEIKKAYRKLAIKFHPDKNQGDKKAEEKFKEINEAHDVLGDPEKRKKYDLLGDDWQNYQSGAQEYARNNQSRSRQTGGSEFFQGGEGGFSDFFEHLFGSNTGFSRQRSAMQKKGEDYQTIAHISLEDAFNGTTLQVKLNDQSLNLKLKPGVANGQKLKMTGKGGPGINGGPAGDIFITVEIKENQKFSRKGDDIYIDQPLDIFTATLGGKLAVDTIQKQLNINIPAGTDSNKTFRLKGMGMPNYQHPETFGDCFVRVIIQVPKNLDEKDKELFNQLSRLK